MVMSPLPKTVAEIEIGAVSSKFCLFHMVISPLLKPVAEFKIDAVSSKFCLVPRGVIIFSVSLKFLDKNLILLNGFVKSRVFQCNS